jgi:hypothetical protein
MRMSTQRRLTRRAPVASRRRRRPVDAPVDAAIEPESSPEAVFDRTTGPYGGSFGGAYAYRSAHALPGACEYDEET